MVSREAILHVWERNTQSAIQGHLCSIFDGVQKSHSSWLLLKPLLQKKIGTARKVGKHLLQYIYVGKRGTGDDLQRVFHYKHYFIIVEAG